MSQRRFIVDGEIIAIQESQIKEYFAYPECFVKDQQELYVFNGKIYVSEDGEYCNGSDCTVPIPQGIVDDKGNPLCHSQKDFSLESFQGFIYNQKLYFTDKLTEI